MHDPKFEKEVQQKMEELKFSPSEAVWTKLEKDLQKEKRRPMPLFWLFFLVGGMLLGAGGTWLFYATGSHTAVPSSPEIARNSPGKSDTQNAVVAGPRISGTAKLVAQRPKTRQSAGMTASTPTASSGMTAVISAGTAVAAPAGTSASTPAGSFVASPAGTRAAPHAKDSGTILAHQIKVSAFATSGSQAAPTHRDQDDQSEIIMERSAVKGLPARVGSGFNGSPIIAASKEIPANVLAKIPTSKKPRLYKAPVWEAGFAGGAGISGVNNGLLQRSASAQLSAVSNAGPTPAYLFNSPSNSAPAATNYSPKIGSGPSFWAGVFVQKPVLKKLSLSLGLNVHYYSTRIVTGQQVTNNPPTPSNSLFYSSFAARSSLSYPYYPAGDSYAYQNKYYFLEFPVSLQWQINPGRRIPLFWEGGLSVTRLMGVNALYYNESSGVYYKYGGQPNPVRFYASMAFMAGLRRGDTRIQLGPEFQYGLTRLSNENSNSGQHLFYGGIKITVVPGRK